jgi:CBS domain-containing protein
MNAADVMTRRVITTNPNSTVRDVAITLIKNHISAVPVVGVDGKLLGIVSEGDLLRRSETQTERQRPWWLACLTSSETLATEFVKTHSRNVSDVMTRKVITAKPNTPLHRIATLLEQHRIKRVPIVKDERIEGLVSRANLVQVLASQPESAAAPATPSDLALRKTVMASLEREPWANLSLINVTAYRGAVNLWGIVDSHEEREAVRVAVEITPGVRTVENNLVIRPILSVA